MNEAVRAALDAVPDRPPRSKLEPHAAVIRELRKKRRTYQEIAAFFREHLQISVAPSTIHEFVKVRAKQARQQKPSASNEIPAAESATAATTVRAEATAAVTETADEIRARIRSLKQQPLPDAEKPVFSFDADQPLRLISTKEKK